MLDFDFSVAFYFCDSILFFRHFQLFYWSVLGKRRLYLEKNCIGKLRTLGELNGEKVDILGLNEMLENVV